MTEGCDPMSPQHDILDSLATLKVATVPDLQEHTGRAADEVADVLQELWVGALVARSRANALRTRVRPDRRCRYILTPAGRAVAARAQAPSGGS